MDDCRLYFIYWEDDKDFQENELEEVHDEIDSLKKGCELIGINVSKIQADIAVLQGRLDNTKVDKILTKRFEDAVRSSEDCPMDNAQDDQGEGSSDSGDQSETDSDCSTCTQSVGETDTYVSKFHIALLPGLPTHFLFLAHRNLRTKATKTPGN